MLESKENAYRVARISQSPYTIPFRFWNASDIQVWVSKNGSDVLLDPTTDYVIEEDQVTLSEETYERYMYYSSITFLRVIDPIQPTDYANGMNIDAEKIERSLDKLTAITQQLSEAQSRSIQASVSEEGGNPVLPPLGGRENSLIGFGPDGKTMITRPVTEFDADVASAERNANISRSSANLARQYSEGKKLDDTDVQADEPGYKNNSKFWADEASKIRPTIYTDLIDYEEGAYTLILNIQYNSAQT